MNDRTFFKRSVISGIHTKSKRKSKLIPNGSSKADNFTGRTLCLNFRRSQSKSHLASSLRLLFVANTEEILSLM